MIKKKMFNGFKMFCGAPFISNLIVIADFLTILLYLSKDENEIYFLDVVQTLFCWPSLFQGLIITFCLWSFRYLERILGQLTLVIYMLYNLISYLPFFVAILLFKGFKYNMSLLIIIPISFLVFTIWRIPEMNVYKNVTDKMIISILMFLVFILSPFQCLVALLSSIIGYNFWEKDIFKLMSFFKKRSLDNLKNEN